MIGKFKAGDMVKMIGRNAPELIAGVVIDPSVDGWPEDFKIYFLVNCVYPEKAALIEIRSSEYYEIVVRA